MTTDPGKPDKSLDEELVFMLTQPVAHHTHKPQKSNPGERHNLQSNRCCADAMAPFGQHRRPISADIRFSHKGNSNQQVDRDKQHSRQDASDSGSSRCGQAAEGGCS